MTGPVASPVAGPVVGSTAGRAAGSGTDPGLGEQVARAAAGLLDREREGVRGVLLSEVLPCLDLATAYQIQDETLRRRLAAGDSLVGVAVGPTLPGRLPADRSEPATGWLTGAMVLPAGTAVPHGRLIRPRVAPELAFCLGDRLAGPGITPARALAAVATVSAGLRVSDSRFLAPCPTGPDLVADNAAVAAFVTGPVAGPPAALDLSLEACLLELDGVVVDAGTGAAVPGGPAAALAAAANRLAARGRALEAGWVVLTGALTDPVPLGPEGVLAAHFSSLGSIVLPATIAAPP